jgi:hypothetical protein
MKAMDSLNSVDEYSHEELSVSPDAHSDSNSLNMADVCGIIVDRYGYIIRNDKTSNYVFLCEDDKVIPLGELGGKITADYIYSNLLQRNAKTAKAMWSPFKFRELVKTKGEWDLKNNKRTIFGLGNKRTTNFIYKGEAVKSQDIGNHHFGYIAKAYGLFPEMFVLRQAGNYQIKSGTSKKEWQEDARLLFLPNPMSAGPVVHQVKAPYGDNPRDQMWIKKGFADYKESKRDI